MENRAALFSHTNPLWYSRHLTVASWKLQYAGPILDADEEVRGGYRVFPPNVVRRKGRPRRRRMTTAAEARRNTCAYCGQRGHHRSSCVTPASRNLVESTNLLAAVLAFPPLPAELASGFALHADLPILTEELQIDVGDDADAGEDASSSEDGSD